MAARFPNKRRIFIPPSVIPHAFACCLCGICTTLPTGVPGVHVRDCANPACRHTPLWCSACKRLNHAGVELPPQSCALLLPIAGNGDGNGDDYANTTRLMSSLSWNGNYGKLDLSPSLPDTTPATWMCGWCGNTTLPVWDILVDEQPRCCEAPILRAIFDKAANMMWQAQDASKMKDIRKDAELRAAQEFLWLNGSGAYLEEVESFVLSEDARTQRTTPARGACGRSRDAGPVAGSSTQPASPIASHVHHTVSPHTPTPRLKKETFRTPTVPTLGLSALSSPALSLTPASLLPGLMSDSMRLLSSPLNLQSTENKPAYSPDPFLNLPGKESLSVGKPKKKKKERLPRVGKGQGSGRRASVAKHQKDLGMETSRVAKTGLVLGAELTIKPANEPASGPVTQEESKPAGTVEYAPGRTELPEPQPSAILSTNLSPTQVAGAGGTNEKAEKAAEEGEETVEGMLLQMYRAGYM